MKSRTRAVAAAWVMAVAGGVASGQWSVVSLHPPAGSGIVASAAQAVGDGSGRPQQAGAVFPAVGVRHAALWEGAASSWVDLHPAAAGAEESSAMGCGGGGSGGPAVQVGSATIDGLAHAGLWRGAASSWVDLRPAGAADSSAFAVSGGSQAGYARFGGLEHAGMWTGTPESWVSLHPVGLEGPSIALGMDADAQVGYAYINFMLHAVLWRGTPGSMVDLHPAGAGLSSATGVSGPWQVGYFRGPRGGGEELHHACVWRGTPESVADLHPAGMRESYGAGIDGRWQVGYATDETGRYHAFAWRGSARSAADLSEILPAGSWGSTFATGVWTDGETLYVSGSGRNLDAGRDEALLWSRPLPCGADFDANGQVDFFDYLDFAIAFEAGGPDADFDGNGQVDFFDYLDFAIAFEAGC